MSENRVLPLAEARATLSKLVDSVERTHERVTVTRNGRPVAVVISPDDLESLEETLALLQDPDALSAIREADAEIDRGEALTGEQLADKYPARPDR